jgi:hypothetical protein
LTRFNIRIPIRCTAVMAVSSLRVQNRRAALVALANQLRPAQDAKVLLLKKMREIAAFWA